MQATIYFDGSLREKINHSAWIAIIQSKPTTIAYDVVKTYKMPDSTVAEWRAILEALNWLKKIKTLSKITIRGDNISVINSINSGKNLKRSRLSGYSSQCLNLLKEINVKFEARKVERHNNFHADSLSKGNKFKFIPENDMEKNEHKDYIKKIIAEHLWKENGSPENKDELFWFEAERLLDLALI